MSKYKHIPIEDLEVGGNTIGVGGFGQVFQGIWNGEGQGINVAIKQVYAQDGQSLDDICQEAEAFEQARTGHNSTNVLYGICIIDECILWLVMKLFSQGDLHKFLSKTGPLTLRHLYDLCLSATEDLHRFHAKKMLHRDIKSFNYLVSDSGRSLHLTDFGMSKEVPLAGKTLGTLAWTPPEVLSGESEWTEKSDVYSLGMVFYEMVTRRMPFEGESDEEITKKVLSFARPLGLPCNLQPEFCSIIQSCWMDPPNRPSTFQLLGKIRELRDNVYRAEIADLQLHASDLVRNELLAISQEFDPEKINDFADGFGNTPLLLAVGRGTFYNVKEIISLGANVNHTNFRGETALMTATITNWVDVVMLLLESGAKASLECHTTELGFTALIFAAQLGRLDVLKILLENGADVHARDNNNMTALQYATAFGSIECVRLLVDKGAELDGGLNGVSALLVAAQHGRSEIIGDLIQLGMEIDFPDPEGETALHYAVKHENTLETARKLVELGANVNAEGVNGNTPLMNAAAAGPVAAVELLVQNGAELEKVDSIGRTALMAAASKARTQNFLELVKLGANWSSRDNGDNGGASVLTYAVYGGATEIIDALIQYGAQLEPQDLLSAAHIGDLSLVVTVLKYWTSEEMEPLNSAIEIARKRRNGWAESTLVNHKQMLELNIAARKSLSMFSMPGIDWTMDPDQFAKKFG